MALVEVEIKSIYIEFICFACLAMILSSQQSEFIRIVFHLIILIIMVYQKIINLLGNTSNQLSKFRTKICIEINDQSRGVCNTNSDIRFKTTMLKSSLCDYSISFILVKGRITITGAGADAAARQTDARYKRVIFKNYAPFINCKTEINNTEIDNAKGIDIVREMYNLIEYRDNYSKAPESL